MRNVGLIFFLKNEMIAHKKNSDVTNINLGRRQKLKKKQLKQDEQSHCSQT